MKNKIFNKHFLGMISTFILIIIGVTTFIAFLEEASVNDKTLNQTN